MSEESTGHPSLGRSSGSGIGVDDVAELRALLRRRDAAARSLGLALLAAWTPAQLDSLGARAVLEAAGGSYPPLDGDPVDPAELLAQLLWSAPGAVAPTYVARVYLVAGERARRAMLHLLALRRDDEGLAVIEELLGADADPSTVPAPGVPLLAPLAEHAERERVARLACVALERPLWTWHAAELMVEVCAAGPLPEACLDEVRSVLARAVDRLVAECDAAMADDPRHADGARSERETLVAVAPLIDHLCTPSGAAPADDLSGAAQLDRAVQRMAASADPRVGALGVVRRVRVGAPVAPERLGLLARDPVARIELFDAIGDGVESLRAADEHYDDVALHEGRLARLLAEVTELGRVPDEMEFVAERPVRGAAVDATTSATVHLFRFRMRSPHWSAARGWMIGASGAFTYTCYAAEDDDDLDGHVTAMATALAQWPGQSADGAA